MTRHPKLVTDQGFVFVLRGEQYRGSDDGTVTHVTTGRELPWNDGIDLMLDPAVEWVDSAPLAQ